MDDLSRILRWAGSRWPWAVVGTALLGCTPAGERTARSDWTVAAEVISPRVEPAPSPISLDELQALAEARNAGLRAAYDRWTAALEQVPQATSLPDPRLSYSYLFEPVETRVGPQRQRIGLAQTFPLGKLGLRGDVAVGAANMAGAQFEVARRQLRFELARLWHDYAYLGRAIAITEENLQLLTSLERVALSQYAAGRAPHATVIRAQVELGRLEDRLRTLRDQQRPLLASINAELDRPADTPLPWPEVADATEVEASEEQLRALLLASSPELAALAAAEARDAASARLAGRNRWPDLMLGVEVMMNEEARMPGVADSGQDAAMAMASINLPLWWGRTAAEREQAQARRSASRHDLTQARNRLLARFDRVHFELRDARRRVELYAFTLLPRARQSVEVTEDAFTTGEAGFLDLIDAQRTLLEFELSHERARADHATRLAQLEQIVGVDLNTSPSNGDKP